MSKIFRNLDRFRVKPGNDFRLADNDPGWCGDDDGLERSERKKLAKRALREDVKKLTEAQELLYADDSWSLLLIFQAMDAAGKDSTIKHVMSGVNPQGTQVFSFKHPTAEELDHNFLWRCMVDLPERGRIGIFNRSYYEEVLITRVHPELIHAQNVPGANPDSEEFWEHRYQDINAFERHLTRNGTAILKFFLNVSKEEQRERFYDRIDRPEKNWKFSAGDVRERQHWDSYMQAYESCLRRTSTETAPWYVIPADRKWVTRSVVSGVIVSTIQALGLKWPEVSEEHRRDLAEARRLLEGEGEGEAGAE